MERFARTLVGYHGCQKAFATKLLLGEQLIENWTPSENAWDWLGSGIYFWEHSPNRALRWAREKYGSQGAVVGAVIQLGRCFDLLDESITQILADAYNELTRAFGDENQQLPENRGRDGKLRELDCLVINDCLGRFQYQGIFYDTVRGAFIEGDPVYPTAGFTRETHIQVAVRNRNCIIGVFRPNLEAT